MDVQVKAGSLVRTIVDQEISGIVRKIVSPLQTELTSVVAGFLSTGVSAATYMLLSRMPRYGGIE